MEVSLVQAAGRGGRAMDAIPPGMERRIRFYPRFVLSKEILGEEGRSFPAR
jgi:hypothetical protein